VLFAPLLLDTLTAIDEPDRKTYTINSTLKWSVLSMSGQVLELTDDTFEEMVLQSEVPAMVDFWAEWCAPCKAIAPVVASLAEEYAGKVRVGKLNVDENPKTASRFSIRGIPTLLIFNNGEVQEQIIGAQPVGVIKQSLDKVVG
jgi:thioredoxin 1